MTNYRIALASALALSAGIVSAADAAALPRYVQAQAGSSLAFTFDQAGAASKGGFKKFTTELRYDEKAPETCSLNVKIETASVDTQDQERDEMLRAADLFDAQKYPTAQYVANSCARRADGSVEAVGKLTLRGVTRDLRLPLKITRTASGLDLSGEAAIKRLDYGVGQGDFKATDSVGDEVKLHYKVALAKAP
jgi:polyisoprenoid-binding protein YceI